MLRYRVVVSEGGTLRTKEKSHRVCPVDAEHKTRKSVESLVAAVMAQVDGYKTCDPSKVMTLGDFVETVFLPYCAENVRKKTAREYRNVWQNHLRPRCQNALLREVRTYHVTRWIQSIVEQNLTKEGLTLARNTVARIKAFLSSAFRHAISEGYADGVNPVTLAMIPKRTRPKKATFAYSMADVLTMMSVVPEDVQVVMMTAALTGLRRSELQGLEWADYHDGAIFVQRSIVDGEKNPTKTLASAAPVQ